MVSIIILLRRCHVHPCIVLLYGFGLPTCLALSDLLLVITLNAFTRKQKTGNLTTLVLDLQNCWQQYCLA